MTTIQFLGAAETVTGSRYLLAYENQKLLIDCGLFQGKKEHRLRNWAPSPVDPKGIDVVVLTHAHIDHSGGLPRLVKEGFRGPVYATSGTRDLCGLLLPDSARIHQEEARYANKEGYSKHRPALALYTEEDAHAALRLFETFGFERPRKIAPGVTLRFRRAGHILGSAICIFEFEKTKQRVVFTGDLGRYDAPILTDPDPIESATTLILESTYGDRLHEQNDPMAELQAAVAEAVTRRGLLLIPAFAVGRTQEILYRLGILEREKRIPELPVFVDSPMACDATPIYLSHTHEHDTEMKRVTQSENGESALRTVRTKFVTSVNESKALNQFHGPGIIISASGMATGGRILHHLKHRLPDERNIVLFVGYQPEGTRGRRLLDGEKSVKIHGQQVQVKSKIANISGFSAHADWKEILKWMNGFAAPPAQTILVHGEPASLEALRVKVAERGWPVQIAKYLETIELPLPSGESSSDSSS